MNDTRFTATRIASSLRLLAMGRQIGEICLRGGFPPATLLQWQHRYAGLSVDELRCLRALEQQMREHHPALPPLRESPPELILATARCVRCTPQRLVRHPPDRRGGIPRTCRQDCHGH